MGVAAARSHRRPGAMPAMNQTEALQKIQRLGVPSFETRDVSALLRVTPANASALLSRLAGRGFVRRLARGRWSIGELTNREQLAEQVAAPSPAYVSLQSALFRHNLIEQVPEMLYAVTLGRARRVRTPSGTVSLHRMPPALFGGYETSDDGTKVATAEKALFDLLYLGPTRSRLFSSLPEMELPRSFRWAELKGWIRKIPGPSRRTYVEQKVASLRLAHVPPRTTAGGRSMRASSPRALRSSACPISPMKSPKEGTTAPT